MIESALLNGVMQSPSSSSLPPVPQTVLSGDLESFRAAMMAPQAPASAMVAADVQSASFPPIPAGNPTLGDTILSGMRSVAEDTKKRYQVAAELLQKPNPSVSELMTLQYSLLQSSLQFEMVSKGISTTTRNLDSILKTQ
jgi:hypothetical protein